MRKLTVVLAISALMLLISGCYTILQHPASETNYDAEDYRADCLGCHADYHEYPYGYFYGNYPDYWWSSPRWGYYYAYPWWWDNYWYDGSRKYSRDNDDEYSPRSSSGEKVVRRDALRPPYTMGTTSITRSGAASETESGNGKVGAKASGDDTQKKQGDDKVQDKKEKKEEKDNKKATRRGGGR
jgi:hypothetical protein